MPVFYEIRRRARQIAPQVLLACLAAYFGYHAIQGDRGVLARLRLEQELAEARALDRQLAREQARLTRNVELMRSDHLDRDLLEEQARLMLNFGESNDYLVLRPDGGDAAGNRLTEK
jgi:cell division protein FtsB